jgi:hypothetical protein
VEKLPTVGQGLRERVPELSGGLAVEFPACLAHVEQNCLVVGRGCGRCAVR